MDDKGYFEDFNLPPSESYKKFKEEESELFKLNKFESLCKLSSRIVMIKTPKFIREGLEDPIYMSDLKVTPDEVFSFFLTSFFISMLFLSPSILFLDFTTSTLLMVGIPAFIAYNVISYPILYSDIIRIMAGNETVDIILYMVIYLSLNPVYEKAVEFAAINCHGPLGKDFKKILWDVEMGNYTTTKSAMGVYSKKWTIWNEEFVTSLITLQMVGLQSSQDRRREILQEGLDRTLTSTYTKMEEYARNMKIPSAMLLSFGILLPMMGLIMFPLVSIFLTEAINPVYMAVGYTIVLPYLLWWYLGRLISKRPSAFSHSGKTGGIKPAEYIEIPKYNLKLPIKQIAILIGLLVILPGILYIFTLYFDYNYIHTHYTPYDSEVKWKNYCLEKYGPGIILIEVTQAMFIIWGIAIAIIFYTYFRSYERYKLEEYIRKTEIDFEVGLFELQSALTQNIPMELAIPNILDKYERMSKQNSPMYDFFDKIYYSITHLAMTFKQALFDEERGVLKDFPSQLIENIMNIISGALIRGPLIVSNAAKNIVHCLKKTREIEAMIKNLLEDIVSNLKTQSSFIAPMMSGIVASVGVLIVQLLQTIAKALSAVEETYGFGSGAGDAAFSGLDIIKLEEVMPPTLLELIVGIYLIECVVIMCIFLTGIERGFDDVSRDYMIARTLSIAVIFFTVIFFTMIIVFQPIISKVAGIT